MQLTDGLTFVGHLVKKVGRTVSKYSLRHIVSKLTVNEKSTFSSEAIDGMLVLHLGFLGVWPCLSFLLEVGQDDDKVSRCQQWSKSCLYWEHFCSSHCYICHLDPTIFLVVQRPMLSIITQVNVTTFYSIGNIYICGFFRNL